jgi:hypothetical protein
MKATLHVNLDAFFGERGMGHGRPVGERDKVVHSGDAGKSAG